MNWRKPLIFGLLHLSGSKVPKYLVESIAVSDMPLVDAGKLQEDRMKKMLLYCYDNCSYYKDILHKCGAVEDGSVDLSKWDKIPILTKDVLKKNYDGLRSGRRTRKPYVNTSGGSTGEPTKFMQDADYWNKNVANKILFCLKNGKDVGEKETKLWGSERDFVEGTTGVVSKLKNWLYNRQFINTFDTSDKNLKKIISELNKFKPKLVWGYVDSLVIISEFAVKNEISIHKPEVVISAAGTLTEDARKLIKKAFSSKVVNVYGSREVGDMAYEVEEGSGLCLYPETHKLEVLDDGRIIVTTLTNYTMPLIRYEIGDVSSGLKDGKLLDVQGRVTDFFVLKNGKKIPPEYFIHIVGVVYNTGFIKKFQLVQKDYDKVLLKIVLDGKEDKKAISDIEKAIKKVMEKGCKVEVEYVDGIDATQSGKYRYVVSEVYG